MDGDPAVMKVPRSSSVEVKEDMDTKSEKQATGDTLIDISFCGSTPMLWKVPDMKKCRSEGVIGALVGSLARQPRQNVRLGRPLELRPEEALLLLEEEKSTAAVRLDTQQDFEDREAHSEAVRLYEASLESSYQEQCVLALEDKKKTLNRVMNEKENGTEGSGSAVRERLEALDQSFRFPWSAMAVQLCTARSGFSHCPEERSFHSTDCPMPRDEHLNTRFSVYRDLRNKGYYLTSAGKFGGDFLVYPGDPLRFHAHYIALCVSLDEEMPVCDILAIARLGSNVKKTVLLCSPQDGDVVYSSLQWSSMV
uniref:tRNA-splicing endonuclease subunit Sen34 n=1 Tax=Danio rerio TaxID=7955 RepID=A2BIL9_DANRE|nr:tRNA-splicing endonuclease subunit Sen34 isoform 1 [Danio rerio]|eukprot:XP_005159289.1 tRNA-splicing endonuclease subunit Sen34 isoform X1 [Danio rerio]